MATEFEREIFDVLTSIRHSCSLDDAGLLLQPNGKRHLRSAEQMCRLFEDVPEAIAASGEVSDRLSFQMKDMATSSRATPSPLGRLWTAFCASVNTGPSGSRYAIASSFVCIVWEEIERHIGDEETVMKSNHGNRLSSQGVCPHCGTQVDARTFPG